MRVEKQDLERGVGSSGWIHYDSLGPSGLINVSALLEVEEASRHKAVVLSPSSPNAPLPFARCQANN